MGRSFETSTVPNLKFPNYDSACERSYWWLLISTVNIPHNIRLIVLDCFHTTAKCVFWILEMRILNYVVYTWSKYLRKLRIIHTSDRKCDSPFEWRRGMAVSSACQSNMTCVVYVSFAWPRGIIVVEGWSHSYTDFVAWFELENTSVPWFEMRINCEHTS